MVLTLYLSSLSDKGKKPWLGSPDADGSVWAAVYDSARPQTVQALLPKGARVTQIIFAGMCQDCSNQLALELGCKDQQVWTEEAEALWSELLLSELKAVKDAA